MDMIHESFTTNTDTQPCISNAVSELKSKGEGTDNEAEGDRSTEYENKAEEKSTSWPLQGIQDPHDNDVLYGKDDNNSQHPGNQRYREIIERRRLEYDNSDRLSKPLVALDIIREWRSQDPPGRFLKQNKEGIWNDVGDKKAREKISQALRKKSTISIDNTSNNADGEIRAVNHDSQSNNNHISNNKGINNARDTNECRNVTTVLKTAGIAITNIAASASKTPTKRDATTSNNHDITLDVNDNCSNESHGSGTKESAKEIAVNNGGSRRDLGGRSSSGNESKLFTDKWLDRLREKLYARKEEQRMILDAYHRCLAMNNNNTYYNSYTGHNDDNKEEHIDLILISGPVGTGKTILAKSLERTVVNDDGGYFITCKFRQQLQQQQPKQRSWKQSHQQKQQRGQQQQQQYPCCAVVEALSDFIKKIIQQGGQVVHDIRYHMYKEINMHTIHDDGYKNHRQSQKQQEWNILLKMIPSLNTLLHSDHSQLAHTEGDRKVHNTASTFLVDHDMIIQKNDISNHLVSAMKMLMRIISSSLQRPILLLYDDIQYADAPSLCFLRSLQSKKIENLVVVATATCTCSRCSSDANASSSQPHVTVNGSTSCTDLLSRINPHNDYKLYDIKLRNPSKQFIKNTIQKAMEIEKTAKRMNMSESLSFQSQALKPIAVSKMMIDNGCDVGDSLASLFASQTQGNIFYVIEFIRFLIDEHLLMYDIENRLWKHNEQQILHNMTLFHNDNRHHLGDFFIHKLQKSSANVQQLLKVASCLCYGGHYENSSIGNNAGAPSTTITTKIHVQLLKLVLPFPIQPIIDELIAKGIFSYDDQHDTYNFCHDAIQQAAYSLIEQDSHDAHNNHRYPKEKPNVRNTSDTSTASTSSNASNSTNGNRNRLHCNKEYFHLIVARDLWKALVIDNDKSNKNDERDSKNDDTNSSNELSLLDEHIFILLSQYEKGRSFLKNDVEKYAIAALCLHGAKLAANTSNFGIALHYLNFAIHTLLVENDYVNSSTGGTNTSSNAIKDMYNASTDFFPEEEQQQQPTTRRESMFSKQNKKKKHCDSCWRDRYELTLAIYNAAAEMELLHGNIENAERYVQEVLDKVHNDNDKIQAYCSKIYLLGVINQPLESVNLGIHVLKRLGETFPTQHGFVRFKHEMCYVKKLLKKITGSRYLRSSPDVPSKLLRRLEFLEVDENKLKCMQILKLMMVQAFMVRPKFAPFIILKLMKLTLLYGLSIYSSIAFSCYGVMCVVAGDIEEGYRFGMLAIDLLHRFQVKHYLPRVYCAVFGGILIWKHPFRDSLQSSLIGYNVGLQTGDIEFAMINAHKYADLLFVMGKVKLDVLAYQIREYCKAVQAYNVTSPLQFLQPLLLTIHNLMSKRKCTNSVNDDSSSSDRSGFSSLQETNNDDFDDTSFNNNGNENFARKDGLLDEFEEALQHEKGTQNASPLLHLFRMVTAYYLHDYKNARKVLVDLRKSRKLPGKNPPGISAIVGEFYETLIQLELAREYKRKKQLFKYNKCMHAVKRSIKRFGYWSTLCPENFSHQLCLLQAEHASVVAYLSKKQKIAYTYNNKAYEKYFAASAMAENSNNYAAQALINERLGYHYHRNMTNSSVTTANALAASGINLDDDDDGVSEMVMQHFRKSISCYEEWGANAKAQHLQEEVNSLFGKKVMTTSPATASSTVSNDAGATDATSRSTT